MSNEHIGRLESLGITKESTSGTAESTPTYWLPKISGFMKPVAEKAKDTGGYGVIEELYDSETVKTMTNTEVAAIVRDDWIGLLLLGALGQVSSANVAGSVYDHTFTVAQSNTHPSFTLFGKDPVSQETSAYNMIDNFEIEAVTGDFVKVKVNFKGMEISSTTGLSVSFTEGNEFLTKHCDVKIAPDSSVVAAAASVDVTRFRLTVNKNVVDYQAFGDANVNSFFNQQFTVTGEFEILYNSVYYRDIFLDEGDDTKRAVQFTLTNTDVTIGSSYNPTITVLLYRVSLTSWEKTDDNNSIVRQTIGFEGEYDVTNAKSIQVTLRNTESSY